MGWVRVNAQLGWAQLNVGLGWRKARVLVGPARLVCKLSLLEAGLGWAWDCTGMWAGLKAALENGLEAVHGWRLSWSLGWMLSGLAWERAWSGLCWAHWGRSGSLLLLWANVLLIWLSSFWNDQLTSFCNFKFVANTFQYTLNSLSSWLLLLTNCFPSGSSLWSSQVHYPFYPPSLPLLLLLLKCGQEIWGVQYMRGARTLPKHSRTHVLSTSMSIKNILKTHKWSQC
jgi:hypothetical protein